MARVVVSIAQSTDAGLSGQHPPDRVLHESLDTSAPYKPWFAGLGALGYWIIGQFGTKPPRLLSAAKIEREEPAVDTTSVAGGIEYYDGILVDNDTRFVFSFVRAAIEAGAAAANYVDEVAERVDGRWVATVRDVDRCEEFRVTAPRSSTPPVRSSTS